jgi:high-affinity K+ transport system ATPase subunit B
MPSVFMAIPVVTLVFSYLFSIQTLIGVKTRSVMFSILGTILMWLTFYFLNLGQAVTYQLGEIGRNPVNMEKLSPDEQATWRRVNGWIEETRAALPKTAETANLMNRVIVLQNGNNLLKEQEQMDGAVGNQAKYEGRHSPAYIVWTSLASELVILGFAAWIFSRRDF